MKLIKRQDDHTVLRRDRLGEIREVGERLEMLVRCYRRLLKGHDTISVAGGTTEMEAGLRLANGELATLTIQLQQLMVEKHEAQHRSFDSRFEAPPVAFEQGAAYGSG